MSALHTARGQNSGWCHSAYLLRLSTLLRAKEARETVGVADVHGGVWSRHAAAVRPVALVQGPVQTLERRGVRICEQTRDARPAKGDVETEHATIGAHHVIRATEGNWCGPN